MDSVFIAGSRALSKLNAQVKERLQNILKRELTVLVGDANGADKAVQRYLAEHRYQNVVVYCMATCRNNAGNWPMRTHTAESCVQRDRHYYGIKDMAMARDASCGFMIWDGISKGTLTNVLNLVNAKKKVLLYISPKKRFFVIRTSDELDQALSACGVRDAAALLASLGSKTTQSQQGQFIYHS
jgi:hypothetical protein